MQSYEKLVNNESLKSEKSMLLAIRTAVTWIFYLFHSLIPSFFHSFIFHFSEAHHFLLFTGRIE